MSSDGNGHTPRSRARRHFLGLAAAAAARAAAVGALASSVWSLPARALGTKWWEHGDGGSGGSNCLLKGTLVATPDGAAAIESLKPGDLIIGVSGETMPVKWVGRQSLRKGGAVWNDVMMPVRIMRHAIDGKIPHRDLYLSPNHALFIDGVLIRVKDLVNGETIVRAPMEDAVDYYNIVLDRHAVVLAEGAAVETFLLRGDSYRTFTNFAEYERLYGEEPGMVMQPCAPVLGYEGARQHMRALMCMSGVLPMRDKVEETYQRLAARAGKCAA
ncbi:hypothetical protein FHS76_003219 [Ochrobactrum daejeonense]|uniref:Hedgehog/Intein (Hint) domain-containing protein n=1 Tax=Brucella daejeonensis TaxID=659015 RepID=A0A7W9EMD8_9HYPH|nr:Hint domain-containing protein [Brucella daejeonensis]MBB5703319.1 hypothetical protein [Brucella daejeonensis]NKB80118.1 Hint domain-containing protein [Brucella daejeonensis]